LVGGILVTLRNVAAEFLFGLKWGEYGRYPTVVVREKRNYIKGSLSFVLGLSLDSTPAFEKMYAIKIRAGENEIFEELGKFGHQGRNYMNLRAVQIKRISGNPNQVGSIIRYRLKFLPVSVDMTLKQAVPGKALFYEVSEKFADNGKLVFEIKHTEDENYRLVIYTAYDYKKGSTIFSKLFWWLFRLLFPAFIHDVVWNHALCTIKEDAERGEEKSGNLVFDPRP
jgi:hypothetical protein